MGNRCQRRARSFADLSVAETFADLSVAEEAEWELILPVQTQMVVRNQRFRKAAKKIIRLLWLRRTWASLGHYLQSHKHDVHFRRKKSLQSTWLLLGNYLRRYAATFRHLHRMKGKLLHK